MSLTDIKSKNDIHKNQLNDKGRVEKLAIIDYLVHVFLVYKENINGEGVKENGEGGGGG